MALEMYYTKIGLYARQSKSLYDLSVALMMISENVGE